MQATNAYLENQVLTATPQKLRLLLIDGALRFAHAGVRHWDAGRDEDALEAVIRCRAIVTELFSVIDASEFAPAAQVRDLYIFLFGELTHAQNTRDAARMHGVVRVLELERETWTRLCEKEPESIVPPHHFQPKEITAANYAGDSGRAHIPQPKAAGFSLDA